MAKSHIAVHYPYSLPPGPSSVKVGTVSDGWFTASPAPRTVSDTSAQVQMSQQWQSKDHCPDHPVPHTFQKR